MRPVLIPLLTSGATAPIPDGLSAFWKELTFDTIKTEKKMDRGIYRLGRSAGRH
jgi:hypothetical protein